MENKFKNILQDGEEIEFQANAYKKAYVLKRMIAPLIILTIATFVLTLVAIFVPYHYVGKGWHGSEYYWNDYTGLPFYVPIIVFFVLGVINLLVFFLSKKGAENYTVAITNKRILIKSGSFRPDYKALPFEEVIGIAQIDCIRSLFDDKEERNCSVSARIPAKMPIFIITPSLVDGYEFSKKLQKETEERKIDYNQVNVI